LIERSVSFRCPSSPILYRHPLCNNPHANLHVLAHHGNHEVEKTDGLNESETQNGVREELATERGVASDTLEKSSEDKSDTDTG